MQDEPSPLCWHSIHLFTDMCICPPSHPQILSVSKSLPVNHAYTVDSEDVSISMLVSKHSREQIQCGAADQGNQAVTQAGFLLH